MAESSSNAPSEGEDFVSCKRELASPLTLKTARNEKCAMSFRPSSMGETAKS